MADRVGQQFGNYKLIRYLGDGAFADVYEGEHVYLKKPVAIKVLRMQLSNSDGESYLIEARIVASLEHPHIVQVLDCGVYLDYGVYKEHVPYLVMNYASHGTLRQRHPDQTILSPTDVLSYVKQIASALQYAHDKKLIHRDVKPANILLGPKDELWLSDFGLAIIAHSSMSRITEDTGGTPSYMAPEQFVGKTCSASDQYALAVMAYEWLCGKRPFQGSERELFYQHMYASIPSLREKELTISPAIEEVVLRALAKDPHERFASVQAFANALEQAYLLAGSGSDLPAPSSQKAFPPMVSQPVSILDAFDTESPTVLSPMGSLPSASEDKQAPGLSNSPVPPVATLPILPVATFREPETPMPAVSPAFPVLPAAMFREPETPMPPVHGISRRRVLIGLGLALAVVSGAVIAWELASPAIDSINGSIATRTSPIKVSPHATTSTPVPTPVPVGTPIFTYRVQKSGVKAVAWSPDGKLIASGGIDHTVHIWNAVSGDEILKPPYSGHSAELNAVAWSPDGKFIASGGGDKTVRVWNAATGKDLLPPYTQHQATVRSVSWSPDGKFIASGSEDKTVHVWNAASGIDLPFSPYTDYSGKVISVAWSPDGQYIASGSLDSTVKIWSLATKKLIRTYSHHTNQVWSVGWSHDGQRIASASVDGTVQIWKPF
ncbi:MAG: protein kinase domain-containing protein [Ktedonobacteraceae bacterium]